MRDPYQILGVPKDASAEDIKSAYRQIVKETHPDMNNGSRAREQEFIEASEAYSILSDPVKRKELDDGIRVDYQEADIRSSVYEMNEFIRNFRYQANEYRDAARKELLKGLIWLAIGLGASFYTYYQATQGYNSSHYYVLWGAIVIGAIQAIRGLSAYVKANSHLNKLEKEVWGSTNASSSQTVHEDNADVKADIKAESKENQYADLYFKKIQELENLKFHLSSEVLLNFETYVTLLAWIAHGINAYGEGDSLAKSFLNKQLKGLSVSHKLTGEQMAYYEENMLGIYAKMNDIRQQVLDKGDDPSLIVVLQAVAFQDINKWRVDYLENAQLLSDFYLDVINQIKTISSSTFNKSAGTNNSNQDNTPESAEEKQEKIKNDYSWLAFILIPLIVIVVIIGIKVANNEADENYYDITRAKAYIAEEYTDRDMRNMAYDMGAQVCYGWDVIRVKEREESDTIKVFYAEYKYDIEDQDEYNGYSLFPYELIVYNDTQYKLEYIPDDPELDEWYIDHGYYE